MAKTSKKTQVEVKNQEANLAANAVEIINAAPAEAQADEASAEAQSEATEQPQKKHLIVAKKTQYGRWYVYFKGVPPEQNVGTGCKTAKSAMRYMQLLRKRYDAIISKTCYDQLKSAVAAEG